MEKGRRRMEKGKRKVILIMVMVPEEIEEKRHKVGKRRVGGGENWRRRELEEKSVGGKNWRRKELDENELEERVGGGWRGGGRRT